MLATGFFVGTETMTIWGFLLSIPTAGLIYSVLFISARLGVPWAKNINDKWGFSLLIGIYATVALFVLVFVGAFVLAAWQAKSWQDGISRKHVIGIGVAAGLLLLPRLFDFLDDRFRK